MITTSLVSTSNTNFLIALLCMKEYHRYRENSVLEKIIVPYLYDKNPICDSGPTGSDQISIWPAFKEVLGLSQSENILPRRTKRVKFCTTYIG